MDAAEELDKYCPPCREDLLASKCPSCGDIEVSLGAWVDKDKARAVQGLIAQGQSIDRLIALGMDIKCKMSSKHS